MARLTDEQRDFLRLVERSHKGREWCTVSDALWNVVRTFQEGLPELVEMDAEKRLVRLTDKARIVLAYM